MGLLLGLFIYLFFLLIVSVVFLKRYIYIYFEKMGSMVSLGFSMKFCF